MSKHLSADQIAEWAAGERNPTLESHLRACAACRAQTDEFQAVLAGFRSSVRDWSNNRYEAGSRPAWRAENATGRMQPRIYWAVAATAAAFCALIAVLVFRGTPPHRVFAYETHSSATDATLMRQVDAEVSQTVPEAMTPLIKLVSWDGSWSAEGMSSSKQSTREAE